MKLYLNDNIDINKFCKENKFKNNLHCITKCKKKQYMHNKYISINKHNKSILHSGYIFHILINLLKRTYMFK